MKEQSRESELSRENRRVACIIQTITVAIEGHVSVTAEPRERKERPKNMVPIPW